MAAGVIALVLQVSVLEVFRIRIRIRSGSRRWKISPHAEKFEPEMIK
jgi:hypothetical protein